ncbi:MAG: DNA primase large subunit PriL [Candidatus Bathyarchaeia archaeon]
MNLSEGIPLSRADLAKYPFTREASQYVESIGLSLGDMDKPEFAPILNRAEERIVEAIKSGESKFREDLDYEVEILSFPVSVALVRALGDPFLKRRFALSEARRIQVLLSSEEPSKIVYLASTALNWKVLMRADLGRSKEFFIGFVDYLKVAPSFHDEKWKLINRIVAEGLVHLTKEELVRLMTEGIRHRFERLVEPKLDLELPKSFRERLERIGEFLSQRKRILKAEELPKVAITGSFPPCLKVLYEALLAGKSISHVGRFTLTSFLLAVGMSSDEIVRLFTGLADADERITLYQVEHIAGRRGSRTKYTPPSCSTLKTHGLCVENGSLCGKVRHPISEYRRRLRLGIRAKEAVVEGSEKVQGKP